MSYKASLVRQLAAAVIMAELNCVLSVCKLVFNLASQDVVTVDCKIA